MRLNIVNRMVGFISFLSFEQLNGFGLGNRAVRWCGRKPSGTIARIGGAAGDDRATTKGSNWRFDNTNHALEAYARLHHLSQMMNGSRHHFLEEGR